MQSNLSRLRQQVHRPFNLVRLNLSNKPNGFPNTCQIQIGQLADCKIIPPIKIPTGAAYDLYFCPSSKGPKMAGGAGIERSGDKW